MARHLAEKATQLGLLGIIDLVHWATKLPVANLKCDHATDQAQYDLIQWRWVAILLKPSQRGTQAHQPRVIAHRLPTTTTSLSTHHLLIFQLSKAKLFVVEVAFTLRRHHATATG